MTAGRRNILSISILMACCWLCFLTTDAQLNFDYTQGKFLIKGKVVDLRSGSSVPLANVKIMPGGRGFTCDNDGNFTLYVSKKDTLVFSSVGYISKAFHVADLDSTKYYILQIELIHDFIKIKEVVIYPFKDVDEFKKAFVDNKNAHGTFMGIAPPKYSNNIPKAKFSNPISFLYDHLKKKGAADPNFKP